MSLALYFGGPPYPLDTAQIGSLPTVSVDVPPLAVFLGIFTTSTTISFLLFEQKRRQRLNHTIPAILFLFSGERVLTCVLRIAWAIKLVNVRLAVASQIFLQAGVVLLFLSNIILAQRIWWDRKPGARTLLGLRIALTTLSTLTVSSLIMVVTSIIVSVYTVDQDTIRICREIQQAGATYFLILAAMPLAMLAMAFSPSASSTNSQGELYHKNHRMAIIAVSSVLCVLNAGFKAGVVWAPPRSLLDPAWYHSRTCLYIFGFTMEVLVLILLYATRADLKFAVTKDGGNANINYDVAAINNG
ncbi:hypothetical protein VMCG_08647 [Cytospora schulzeri]|uniref:G-protein coupled receptors family 3 profile domain-containing protein n=1 Tax=Cytospora schulzeri TaxID=448051 RepID=A0A423VT80_9PEZI|nr:hypothetical protein VMCG_08647 [Valsa malicola]